MPIDPDIARLLQGETERSLPPLRATSVSELRYEFKSAKLAAQAREELPGEVVARSFELEGGAVPLRGRWYQPGDSSLVAATVFFHGGGWVLGDLDTHDGLCRHIAAVARLGVLSVEYRRAPEHPYPAALEDCLSGTRWLLRHAADVGVSERRIGVAGSSAGGNLAAAVALRLRDEAGHDSEHPLAGQLLAYPVLDPTLSLSSDAQYGHAFYLQLSDMRRFVQAYLPIPESRRNADAAPLHAGTLESLPPTVLAVAEFDPLHDDGELYAKRLRASGVEVIYFEGEGLIHGYFGMGDVSPAARLERERVLKAFGGLLRGERPDATRR